MGLLGLFGKGPLSEKKIQKVAKLAANPFAQSDVRLREMQRLLDDGSPAALTGVLKRLAATAQGHIADEDEKKWLEDALVERGEVVLEPLQQFIRGEGKLTYALRAYRRVAQDGEAIRFFVQVLTQYGPEDYRSADAKLQLVWQLSEDLADERVLPALMPFMQDHSDDVRWAVMDLVERAADEGRLRDDDRSQAASHLGNLVTEDDVGPRIQRRAAEILSQRQWQVPAGDAEDLAPLLQEDFFLDKKRFVRRRARRSAPQGNRA